MRFRATAADSRERLDKVISGRLGITRSRAGNLISKSLVTLNGLPAKTGQRVREDDLIVVTPQEEGPGSLEPQDIPLDILYRDEHLVVVDKPAGMVVHPAAGNLSGTLMNALLFHVGRLASVGGPLRPGVVHRLDKDTSGLIVVALSDEAYYGLVGQFKARSTSRNYLALVYGRLEGQGDVIRAIGRSASDRKKMSTRSRSAKSASTRWSSLRVLPSASLLSVSLLTGRTHQIRVHMASIGHPVLGDRTYGGKTSLRLKGREIRFPRQMLHAQTLGFDHPVKGGRLEFLSPIPGDMEQAIAGLEALSGN